MFHLLAAMTFLSLISGPREVDARVQPTSLPALLAQASRDEIQIVDRLQKLRMAVEKLPKNWKAKNVKTLPTGTVLTKPVLLREVEGLEVLAAERWSVLVQSAAFLDKAERPNAYPRKALRELHQSHFEMHKKLDAFNTKLKNGILVNMVAKSTD